VVIDHADLLAVDALGLEVLDHLVHQRLGVGDGGRLLDRAVEKDGLELHAGQCSEADGHYKPLASAG
jgi:hypothetical protein